MTEPAPVPQPYSKLALLHSPTERAAEAAQQLRQSADFVPLEQADAVIAVGGDGFMLDTLHAMLDGKHIMPVFGINLGTVGFLMNPHRKTKDLAARLAKAKPIVVSPLRMEAVTQDGDAHTFCAINEVSLLRETRQTAKIEILVNGKVRIPELAGDGVLLATGDRFDAAVDGIHLVIARHFAATVIMRPKANSSDAFTSLAVAIK